MSVDILQEKIRRLKNPIMLELVMEASDIPGWIREEHPDQAEAYGFYCRELLGVLKGIVPAVRVSFSEFALLGPEGLVQLSSVLKTASEMLLWMLRRFCLRQLPDGSQQLCWEREVRIPAMAW